MAFSMSSAKPTQQKANKTKLLPGTYECSVVNVKEVDSPMYGHGFVLELVVDSGRERVGEPVDYSVFPDAPQKPSKMPPAKRRELDLGKVQKAVAAIHGLPETRAFEIDDNKYAAAIAGPVSPLRGRKVILEAVPRVGADGQPDMNSPAYFYEVLPASVEPVTQVRPVAPKAPALPAKPKPPTLEMALKERGFEVHPDDADFVFNADTGEVIEISEFKLTYNIG